MSRQTLETFAPTPARPKWPPDKATKGGGPKALLARKPSRKEIKEHNLDVPLEPPWKRGRKECPEADGKLESHMRMAGSVFRHFEMRYTGVFRTMTTGVFKGVVRRRLTFHDLP